MWNITASFHVFSARDGTNRHVYNTSNLSRQQSLSVAMGNSTPSSPYRNSTGSASLSPVAAMNNQQLSHQHLSVISPSPAHSPYNHANLLAGVQSPHHHHHHHQNSSNKRAWEGLVRRDKNLVLTITKLFSYYLSLPPLLNTIHFIGALRPIRSRAEKFYHVDVTFLCKLYIHYRCRSAPLKENSKNLSCVQKVRINVLSENWGSSKEPFLGSENDLIRGQML